jgi:SAM-dependent methyltransferase
MIDAGRDEWDVHWDEYGQANHRNPAQHFRRELVLRLLRGQGTPKRLLDIGSGNGELLGAAAERWPDAELLGLELSRAGVSAASARVPSARFRVCDLLQEREPPGPEQGWATHAACSEVLEHVDDPVRLLRQARAWLGPRSVIVITVPGGPMSAFDRHIGHRRHFSPAELREVIDAAGLEPLISTGAGFPFFNLYRVLVIARGDGLIEAARSDRPGSSPGWLLTAAMATFRPLLGLSSRLSARGWQTVAMAREPHVSEPACDRSLGGAGPISSLPAHRCEEMVVDAPQPGQIRV